MSKKLFALLMAALMLLSVAAACGNNDAPVENKPAQPGENNTPATTEKVYKTYLTSEVASLNFLDNVDSNSSTVSSYISSQLWRMYPNEDGTNYIWIDDLADGDPVKIDDYTWQINLNKEAKFHDGTPINADTWMYTFKALLNPKTAFRLATFLYDNSVTIVNGEEYFLQGTVGYPAEVAWEDVGIKKVDEYAFRITTVDIHGDVNAIKKHFDYRALTPVHPEMFESCLSADG